MKKTNLTFMMTLVLSMGLLLSACKKDKNDAAIDSDATRDDAFAESIFDNVSNISNEAYSLSSSSLKSTEDRVYLGQCVSISLDTTANPHALIIDFGDVNCLCNDGKYRRGAIIVSFTGRYWYPGTVITHTFDEYYVNDNHIEGTKVVTNMGFNADNHLVHSIEVVGVIHKANNGGTLSWNSSRTRTWIDGFNTFPLRDDVYLIDGMSNGITATGFTWTKEIVNPLRIELDCRYVVSGTMEIVPEGLATRFVDFGNGDCDNIITVMVNGEIYTIYLP